MVTSVVHVIAVYMPVQWIKVNNFHFNHVIRGKSGETSAIYTPNCGMWARMTSTKGNAIFEKNKTMHNERSLSVSQFPILSYF